MVVARIPAGPIREAELRHWTSVVSAAAATSGEGAKDRVLSFLISSKWLLAEAHELGVAVPASEVKLQVEELEADVAEHATYDKLPSDAELRELLLAPRLAKADRTWLMTLDLLLPRLEMAELARAQQVIPESEVVRYYDRHRRSFYLPDQRQLEIIAGSLQEVKLAKQEVAAGRPFLEVAKLRSHNPEAPGGLWRLLRGHDEPPVEREVFAAKPNVLVGPKQYSMYYIFKVLEVIPAHQETITEAEQAIRRRLAPPSRQVHVALEAQHVAQTTCSAGYVVSGCREYHGATSLADRSHATSERKRA
jgi:hypothetical protein